MIDFSYRKSELQVLSLGLFHPWLLFPLQATLTHSPCLTSQLVLCLSIKIITLRAEANLERLSQ